MQSATRSVDKKKSTINKETKRKNTKKNKKKQLQTSASRGSYIKNVKKKKI